MCGRLPQVLDEADRLLNMEFEQEIDEILKVIPRERRTLLFSATMTSKVRCEAQWSGPLQVGTKSYHMCGARPELGLAARDGKQPSCV